MYKDKNWLEEKYWKNNLSITDISKLCNVSNMTIHKWLVRNNIPRRNLSESNEGIKNGSFVGGVIENYDWVKDKCDNGLSLTDISNVSNVSKSTVSRWLKKHNLKTKGILKHKKGNEHHNWTGKSICLCGNKKDVTSNACQKCYHNDRRDKLTIKNPENYNDVKLSVRNITTPTWRDKVFTRDNYTCQKCFDSSGGNLQAHHIKRFTVIFDEVVSENNFNLNNKDMLLTYTYKISENVKLNDIDNGITLCKKCHQEIHKGTRKDIVNI